MGLNKSQLKTALKNLFTSQYEGDLSTDQDQDLDTLVDDLADALDIYVKTGVVQSGITVQVDPNTGVGQTTGIGNIG